MSNYWKEREAEQRLRLQLKTEKQLERELKKLYSDAANKIIRDMEFLYPTLLEDDVLANNYYKYIRYYKLRERINKRLAALGKNQIKVMEDKFETMYEFSSMKTLKSVSFPISNKKELDQIVKSLWDNRSSWSETVWCKDGLSGSQRVAKQMTRLQNYLERGMSDCVVRGASKEELTKTLIEKFDVGYSEASRLARTELTYIQNQATLDSYKKAGIKQYEYLAEMDGRTSDLCADLNGQRFDCAAAVVGVNYPPLHANCRSTVLAVID